MTLPYFNMHKIIIRIMYSYKSPPYFLRQREKIEAFDPCGTVMVKDLEDLFCWMTHVAHVTEHSGCIHHTHLWFTTVCCTGIIYLLSQFASLGTLLILNSLTALNISCWHSTWLPRWIATTVISVTVFSFLTFWRSWKPASSWWVCFYPFPCRKVPFQSFLKLWPK